MHNGICINCEIVSVLINAFTYGSVHIVANVYKVVGVIRPALMCDEDSLWGIWHIDVVQRMLA